MGQVYLAEHKRMGRRVTNKTGIGSSLIGQSATPESMLKTSHSLTFFFM